MPYLIQILLFLIKSYYSIKINKCKDTNEKYIQNIIYF